MPSTPDLPGTGLTSDEELQQTFVGTLTPHNAPIELAEYDAEWPRLFARTKRELAARVWRHVEHYANAKNEVVEEIVNRIRRT